MAVEWTACPYITINHFDVFIGNFELISHIVPVLTLNKLISARFSQTMAQYIPKYYLWKSEIRILPQKFFFKTTLKQLNVSGSLNCGSSATFLNLTEIDTLTFSQHCSKICITVLNVFA